MQKMTLSCTCLAVCVLLVSIVGCSTKEKDTLPSNSSTNPESPSPASETPIATTSTDPLVSDDPVQVQPVSIVSPQITLSDTNHLKNPNATKEAKILYNYIRDIYGDYIISGQQESTWKGTPDFEINYIKDNTGRLPAIRGLDYINEDFSGVTQRAIAWWELGGIVSICWHWGTPPDGVGYESSKGKIDLEEALTEGSDLYNGMIAQMDRVAEELKVLQEAGVPVLWRPFHEFDGAWFWWGKGGGENFKKLWRLMYDRYTNVHGLNNLIWVLGYSGEVKDGWYPGDEYVDIAGADNYSEGTQLSKYDKVAAIVGTEMPIAYHENGPIPNPDDMIKDGAKWSWFLTWHTMHIMEQNTAEYLNTVFNHDYVLTLDELPKFK
ncbi:MAG: glycosyl hydrolase [Candidatus Cohnella colombiensis]|uniref:Glycosyl hydrolase n=1 Tax=Candidatus Cohnella colombiensis TaxID=3121368 RepID=A0AA95JAR6_9BACL|nr:MAG: glycosyl hydrolase [Cohnella sp.]